jgi:hypothetical protein
MGSTTLAQSTNTLSFQLSISVSKPKKWDVGMPRVLDSLTALACPPNIEGQQHGFPVGSCHAYDISVGSEQVDRLYPIRYISRDLFFVSPPFRSLDSLLPPCPLIGS